MILTVCFFFLTFFLAYCAYAHRGHDPHHESNEVLSLEKKIGLDADNWTSYTPDLEESLAKANLTSAKVIFELPQADGHSLYVGVKKRAKDRRKNRRWEFPGGRVEPGEKIALALLRELSEEDISGVLPRVFKNHLERNPSKLLVRTLVLKNGEQHVLFKTNLDGKDWAELARAWHTNTKKVDEVRTFLLVSLNELNMKDKKISAQWTPKAQKILKALR